MKVFLVIAKELEYGEVDSVAILAKDKNRARELAIDEYDFLVDNICDIIEFGMNETIILDSYELDESMQSTSLETQYEPISIPITKKSKVRVHIDRFLLGAISISIILIGTAMCLALILYAPIWVVILVAFIIGSYYIGYQM